MTAIYMRPLSFNSNNRQMYHSLIFDIRCSSRLYFISAQGCIRVYAMSRSKFLLYFRVYYPHFNNAYFWEKELFYQNDTSRLFIRGQQKNGPTDNRNIIEYSVLFRQYLRANIYCRPTHIILAHQIQVSALRANQTRT